MNIVIDTNKFISALIKDGVTRKIIVNTFDILLFPEYEFEEIFRYKNEILEKSALSNLEFFLLLGHLLSKVTIVSTNEVIDYKKEADTIMKSIDLNDSLFIATALAFDCPVWSDDNHFKQQNKVPIISTYEMLESLP